MRFSPQFLDELRARLPVSEVVGRRVKLKKAGREWKGLSPFNKEKTPSFFVNDQKMAWFDFSSGKNGNIFDFVMLTEGLTFPEAVERLAAQAGMPLPKVSRERRGARASGARRSPTSSSWRRNSSRRRSRRARGAKARGYLADRGIEPATQLKFRLGYAPAERFALKEHLGKAGHLDRGHGRGRAAGRRRRHPGALRPLPRPRDVSDHRSARPRDRLRRPRAREGRAGEISQLAGDAALPQGRDALQHRRRARGRAQGRAGDRGRRLCRRDRHGERRLRGDGRAARHRAHRRPARAALEDGGRADALLRRRRRRPPRRLSGGRSRAAAAQARQEPEIREPARGPGPRRSRALGRARGDRTR